MRRAGPAAILLAALSFAAPPARADVALPTWHAWQGDRSLRAAWLAWSRGQVDAAEAEARAAAHHLPEHADPWRLLCGLLVDSRRWADADVPCERLHALAEDDAPSLLLRSRVALELGRVDDALAAARAAAAAAPGDPAGPLAEALVAARGLHDLESCARSLEEAQRRAPERSLAALPTWPGWEPLADDEAFIARLEALLTRSVSGTSD